MRVVLQLGVNAAVIASVVITFAFAFVLTHKSNGFLCFSHTCAFILAPFVVLSLRRHTQLPLPGMIIVGILCAAGVSALLEGTIYRHLRKVGTRPVGQMLVSFVLTLIATNAVALVWGDATRRLDAGRLDQVVTVWDARITTLQLGMLAWALLLCAGGAYILLATRAGAILRGVASDPELATVVGVNLPVLRWVSAGVAGTLAGAAGLLVGHDAGVAPTMGLEFLFTAVVAAVLGGSRSFSGALVAGVMLIVMQQVIASLAGGYWYEVVTFFLVLIFLRMTSSSAA
jgi:branched-subunit amino acid ABC-type transport system permease component